MLRTVATALQSVEIYCTAVPHTQRNNLNVLLCKNIQGVVIGEWYVERHLKGAYFSCTDICPELLRKTAQNLGLKAVPANNLQWNVLSTAKLTCCFSCGWDSLGPWEMSPNDVSFGQCYLSPDDVPFGQCYLSPNDVPFGQCYLSPNDVHSVSAICPQMTSSRLTHNKLPVRLLRSGLCLV